MKLNIGINEDSNIAMSRMSVKKWILSMVMTLTLMYATGQQLEEYNDYIKANKATDKTANQLVDDFRNLQGAVKRLAIFQLDEQEENYTGGYLGSREYTLDREKKIRNMKYFYQEDIPVMRISYLDYMENKRSELSVFENDGSELYKRVINYNDEGYLQGFTNYSESKKKDKGKFKIKDDKDSLMLKVESVSTKYFNDQPLLVNYHVLSTKMISAFVLYDYHENGNLKSLTHRKKRNILIKEEYNDSGQLVRQFIDLEFVKNNVEQRINDIYTSKLDRQLGEVNLYEIVDIGPDGYKKNQFVHSKDLSLEYPVLGKMKVSYEYEDNLLRSQIFQLDNASKPAHKLVYHYDAGRLDHYEYFKNDVLLWNRVVSYNTYGDITSIINEASNAPHIKFKYIEYDSQGNWIRKTQTDAKGVTNLLVRRIEYYN